MLGAKSSIHADADLRTRDQRLAGFSAGVHAELLARGV
jgi:hypothetical protein